jgi:hypothetical protein
VRDTTKKSSPKRRRRRTKKGLAPITDVVSKTVKRLKLKEKFDEYTIGKHYKELFGKEIAKASHPEKLIKGTLHITVSSSAWLMQISFMKDDMINKISDMFKKKVVKNIVFKVGKIKRHTITIKRAEKLNLSRVKLDDKTRILIRESVKDIGDNALKKSIIAAKTAYYKRKQLKDT